MRKAESEGEDKDEKMAVFCLMRSWKVKAGG
jgi:hypothetical protein